MGGRTPRPSELRLLVLAGGPKASGATPPNKPQESGAPQKKASWQSLQPLALPYPSAPEVPVDFFVRGEVIYEINKSCRSVGTCSALLPPQLLLGDGSLLLATPMDPLLLLLPHLRQTAATAFLPLLDAAAPNKLDANLRSNLQALAQHPAVLRRLHCTCDLRLLNCEAAAAETEPPAADATAAAAAVTAEEGRERLSAALSGCLFVRFNSAKTTDFLLRKHNKLARAISAQRVAPSAFSAATASAVAHSSSSPPAAAAAAATAAAAADPGSHSLAFSIFSAYLVKPLAAAVEQRLKREGLLSEGRQCGASGTECKQISAKAKASSRNTTAAAAATPTIKALNVKAGTRLKRAAGSAAATANSKKTQTGKRPA
ncbi:hypothetical protein, conserved [Eimeria tenella]|uniref:Uncharacterized protein n=1 Tax=Eimeria tenella TaxID=5802 RepID=U6KM25_EIMTE|nr:hypothetical protein, conserved [Eimeria tenella]CDJ39046.1 hypothetical protein, conserved [Eimeria tenella]|eukprot:XP_013229801.1 hypothetical protein, conserved [Eimeria tenella]